MTVSRRERCCPIILGYCEQRLWYKPTACLFSVISSLSLQYLVTTTRITWSRIPYLIWSGLSEPVASSHHTMFYRTLGHAESDLRVGGNPCLREILDVNYTSRYDVQRPWPWPQSLRRIRLNEITLSCFIWDKARVEFKCKYRPYLIPGTFWWPHDQSLKINYKQWLPFRLSNHLHAYFFTMLFC